MEIVGIFIILILFAFVVKACEFVAPVFEGAGNLLILLWANKALVAGIFCLIGAIFFIRLFQTSSGLSFFLKFKEQDQKRRSQKREAALAIKKERNENLIVHNDKVEASITEDDLQPIDDLNIDEFARHAAKYFQDPGRFNDFLTGWYHRYQLDKNVETVNKLTNLMNSMREASRSARELQEEIIQNRVIFKYQAQFAIERLKSQWEIEKLAMELEKLRLQAEMERQRMITDFYKNPREFVMTDSIKEMLSMLQPIEVVIQSESGMMGTSSLSKYSFTDPANLMNLSVQKQMADVLAQQIAVNLEAKKAEADIKRGYAKREHIQAKKEQYDVEAEIREDEESRRR